MITDKDDNYIRLAKIHTVMKELFITIGIKGGGYQYYKTNADTAKEAFEEYLAKQESIGVNTNNTYFGYAVLRSGINGEPLDIYYIDDEDPDEHTATELAHDIRVIMKKNPNRTPKSDEKLKKMLMAMFEEE